MASTTLAALSTLQPRHCFGVAGRLRDGLAFLEDNVVVYPCGQAVVVYNAETRTQRFVQGSPDGQGLTAFAVCPAKRVLALAERGAEKASISIIDLQTYKRRKVLTSSEGCKEFVSLSFSSDGKYIAAQGGAPEWTLSLWIWERSKLVASVRTVTTPGLSVHQCLIQPGDETQVISVAGEGTCRAYRIETGNSLKPLASVLAKRESQSYTAHAWLVDNDSKEALVVGTTAGEVLVAQEGDVKQALQLEGGAGVACLAAFSRGFVVGTTAGSLVVYERDNESKPYHLARHFDIEPVAIPPTGLTAAAAGACCVRSLAASPGEQGGVACLTADGQLLLLGAASADKKGAAYSSVHALAPGFHTGEVTGLATCVRRPVLATAGQDKTIRLWNYMERSTELVKAFDEEIHSLALHPAGYTLLAGFADKLRLMTVLADDLRVVKELPIKASRDCAFSNGGHLFAAVNNNMVHVYHSYTGAPVTVLRGHTGRVRSLWWSADDTVLVTAGVDGALYEWRVLDGRRERDFVQKGWNYTSAVGLNASPNASQAAAGGNATPGSWPTVVFVAAADRKLRMLEDSGSGGLALATEVDTGSVLTQLIAPSSTAGRLLFAATEDGSVRSYKLPLNAEFQAARCGGGAVTRIAVTHDEAVLFAATTEGCVFVFDVKDRDPTRALSRKEGEDGAWAEEVLVGRGDIDDKRQRMAELEAQVTEVTAQNEYQLKLKDLALNERVRELTEKAAAEAEAAKQRYDSLLAARNALEVAYEERLRSADEKHGAQLDALDVQYQQKLIAELERYQDLQRDHQAAAQRWEAQTVGLVEQHARVVAEAREGYERQLEAEQVARQAMVREREEAEAEWREVRRQLDEDVDREVETVKDRTQKQLAGERDANLRLQGENGILKRRYEEQAKAIEASRAALKAMEGEKNGLEAVIAGLRADVAALQREVAGRDEAIAEKEKRILDLKLKAQELEKFRFVLDYKLGELRAQLDPKDLELADLKTLVQRLEDQLEAVNRSQAGSALAASEAKQREAALQREVGRARSAAGEAQRGLRRVQCDIHAVAQLIQSPDQLKAAVVRLYQAHAAEEPAAAGKSAHVAAEQQGAGSSSSNDSGAAARQVELLEATCKGLRQQLEQQAKSAAAVHRRMVQENSSLIATINELRRDLKALQDAGRSGAAAGGGGGAGGLIKAVRAGTLSPASRALPLVGASTTQNEASG